VQDTDIVLINGLYIMQPVSEDADIGFKRLQWHKSIMNRQAHPTVAVLADMLP
jgi:hypothetical protein